jgi:hypothetical protein
MLDESGKYTEHGGHIDHVLGKPTNKNQGHGN